MKRLLDILSTHKNEKLRRLLRISLFTGIRRSELLFIEHGDVNLDERFFRTVNIKSRDKHKVWREIPEQVFDDFVYFMSKY